MSLASKMKRNVMLELQQGDFNSLVLVSSPTCCVQLLYGKKCKFGSTKKPVQIIIVHSFDNKLFMPSTGPWLSSILPHE